MFSTNTPPNAATLRQCFPTAAPVLLDATPVRDGFGSSPAIFKTPAEGSTLGTISVGVLVTDIHTSIHVLDCEFVAHLGGRGTHLAEKRGVLVTLGEEEVTRLPLLKKWDLEHNEKMTGLPLLPRPVKVQGGSGPHPVRTPGLKHPRELILKTSLRSLQSRYHTPSHLAIGLADGTVLLYQHLDQSLFAGSNRLTSLAKPKIILDSATEPITRLGFREPDERPDEDEDEDEDLHLFIVTTDRVLVYLASGKESGGTPAVIDEVGAGLGCAVMDQRAREIVTGPDDAINVRGLEERGACFAIEWPKISIRAYGVYLTVVLLPSLTSNSGTVRNAIGRVPNPMFSMSKIFTLLTSTSTCVAAKFIAYPEVCKEGVRDVALSAADSLYFAAYFAMHALFTQAHGFHTHLV
ncbi:hypothetical protein BOTBODRAFT_190653 [Botryobasidium botryosum FD-172 SS1]|uniref:PEP5/VPS11 N-terminal domain-containing protein n=1 Tax=Botryobasidium botryosum (strain FD-172 SS1) TaxID=930990 RepID=A0A067M337_BOTB1|nr:hypothetical protein BOTBODRAFT_190653 [Botryobasidium botryosum FD-172 SS1]